jgi:hypothetical protein
MLLFYKDFPMRPMTALYTVLFTLSLSSIGHGATPNHPDIRECDRLASMPSDASARGRGIPMESLDENATISACARAVRVAPQDANSNLQLARGLDKLGMIDEAKHYYSKAKSLGAHVPASILADAQARADEKARLQAEAAERHAQMVSAAIGMLAMVMGGGGGGEVSSVDRCIDEPYLAMCREPAPAPPSPPPAPLPYVGGGGGIWSTGAGY